MEIKKIIKQIRIKRNLLKNRKDYANFLYSIVNEDGSPRFPIDYLKKIINAK